MIKVLIADDELIVRKGLMATVNWEKYNMTVIADAPNGQKAWELFEEHRPEIVITDIVMPEMNGIELARKIKQLSPATKILLLSCHRDFSYAQEGMNIGASGYILKTAFQDQQFEDYLKRFEGEINSVHQDQKTFDSSSFAKEFYEWLCDFDNSFPMILEGLFLKEWKWMQQPYYIYLLNRLKSSELLHAKLQSEEKLFAKISCGQDQAFIFIPEKSQLQFERLLAEARGMDPTIRWKVNGPNQGIKEWVEGVSTLYRQLKFEKQFNYSMENWPLPIQRAVQKIILHLEEPISSTDIASEVGLSRSHFSTMFKKVVGESFIAFTERIRVQVAQDLLENTSLTSQEISEKIGIQDGKYFSKWFKKCIGITPSDYRQNKKQNIS